MSTETSTAGTAPMPGLPVWSWSGPNTAPGSKVHRRIRSAHLAVQSGASRRSPTVVASQLHRQRTDQGARCMAGPPQRAGQTVGADQSDIGSLLQAELSDGESVLWASQPRQGVYLRPADALFIPFTVLWTGFAIFWTVTVNSSGGGRFALFGVPFVLVGFFMTVGRFFVDAYFRARTVYAVTNRRLIILRTRGRRSSHSTDLRSLGTVGLKEQSTGRATITYGQAVPPPSSARRQRPWRWPLSGSAPASTPSKTGGGFMS